MVFQTVHAGGSVVLGCLATMGLGLILQIVGMATIGWITGSFGVDIGLFQSKFGWGTESMPGDGTCAAGAALIRISQAFSIMAVLISFAYLVFAVMDQLLRMVPNPPLGKALVSVLAVFTLTTWAIYLGVYFKDPCSSQSAKDNGANLGYSFYLYVIGSLMSTGACATHLVKRSIGGSGGSSFEDNSQQPKIADGESPTDYKMAA